MNQNCPLKVEKVCPSCGICKPRSEYYRHRKKTRVGVTPVCKKCWNERSRKRHEQNYSKERERVKYTKQKEKGNKLQNAKRRRARILGAGGSHTIGEWEALKAQHNWTCPCCSKVEPEVKLEADHVIPISKGGSDNIENIQPLCRRCNGKKHTKTIRYLLVLTPKN